MMVFFIFIFLIGWETLLYTKQIYIKQFALYNFTLLGSIVCGLPDGNLLITNTPQKDPLIPEGA